MSKVSERQKFIRHWMDVTGETEIDMKAVAKMALKMGWKPPPPITEEDRLEQQFKDAARQDIRHNNKTGRPYRGYHAVPKYTEEGQLTFSYIDIDQPHTKPESFRKACVFRREQTVDDVVQLRLDQLHWNSQRPTSQHVELLPADMEFDIDIRLAENDGDDEEAA
jgi:hypothetical protein